MKRQFLCALLLAVCAATASAATATKPSLNVTTLDGKNFDLSKQNGKWVIVNYWATWCSPCLKELPDISAYVTAHNFIKHNRDGVEKIADEVVARREIYGDDLVELLQSAKLEQPRVDLMEEASWPVL